MKNNFKFLALVLCLSLASCKKEDVAPEPGTGGGTATGSFLKGNVGPFAYDSESAGGQGNATSVTIPFAGNQIAITTVLADTKTLNLTFFAPTSTGEIDGVCFYSPDGSSANSIGNDDNCPNVSCTVNVTNNNGEFIEGTFVAVLQKSDCSGATTPLTEGTFKAVIPQ